MRARYPSDGIGPWCWFHAGRSDPTTNKPKNQKTVFGRGNTLSLPLSKNLLTCDVNRARMPDAEEIPDLPVVLAIVDYEIGVLTWFE